MSSTEIIEVNSSMIVFSVALFRWIEVMTTKQKPSSPVAADKTFSDDFLDIQWFCIKKQNFAIDRKKNNELRKHRFNQPIRPSHRKIVNESSGQVPFHRISYSRPFRLKSTKDGFCHMDRVAGPTIDPWQVG